MRKKTKFLKLEYLRKKYGYTQADMASFLGIKTGSYSHKVNRRAPFTFDEMLIIREVLNKKAKKVGDEELSLDDIFLGK